MTNSTYRRFNPPKLRRLSKSLFYQNPQPIFPHSKFYGYISLPSFETYIENSEYVSNETKAIPEGTAKNQMDNNLN